MYALIADLLAVFPEFGGTATDVLQFALDSAQQMIGLDAWREKAFYGHIYLAAHILADGSAAGGGGTVSMRKVDKLSISYAVAASLSTEDNTKYGRMYVMLRDSLVILPLVGIA